jgi:Undecaprenyl-phosphate glucose phosphotransferase
MPTLSPVCLSPVSDAGASKADGSLLTAAGGLADALRISPVYLVGMVRFGEFALLACLGFVIAALYVTEVDFAKAQHYLVAPIAAAAMTVALAQALGLYSMSALLNSARHVPRLALVWLVAVAIFVAGAFFLKAQPQFSRVWMALWFVAGLVGLIGFRFLVAALVRKARAEGRLARRAVIYGGGTVCEDLLRALERDTETDVRICGVFDDRAESRVGTSISGYPRLGTSRELVEFGRKSEVDMLIMALPMVAESRLNGLIDKLSVLPVDVRLAGNASRIKLSRHSYSYIGATPVIAVVDKPIDDWGSVAKWLFDKVVAAIAIVVLAPVMVAIAVAVKLESRGPVLFRQKRYGFNNEMIEILKFRSMYIEKCDHSASRLVTRDDPRVTRIGRYIRKASIDELPQLFNVLSGQLSLVGPRPHAVQAKAADKLYPDVVANYFARHKVKPGMTGWAQINGWRGETDTQEKIQKRVEHDLFYIDNWSILFDAYILIKTPFALIKGDNAF